MQSEKPTGKERASCVEKSMWQERATKREKPITRERARQHEKPMIYLTLKLCAWLGSLGYSKPLLIADIVSGFCALTLFMAWWRDRRKWKKLEKFIIFERARRGEKPTARERATDHEKPRPCERARYQEKPT